MQNRILYTAHDKRRIAVEAFRTPKTVERYLAGLPVRSLSATAIAHAMQRLGLPDPRGAFAGMADPLASENESAR